MVILQASRLERWKGHAIHLAALGLLRDIPGWECWLAGGVQKSGEGRFLRELRRAVARAGIADRVRFLGQRADVPRLMAAADVFCQPNTGPEPFGFVLMEALHAGLPVITSDLGGAIEIVNPTCGILTRPGDPRAVAAALLSLINDRASRRALGAVGPARAASLCDPVRQLNTAAELLHPAAPRSESVVLGNLAGTLRHGGQGGADHGCRPSSMGYRAKNGRLRVLHLYSGNLYGGIETFLTTMARSRHLAPEMEPEFGLCFRGRLWDELVATKVTVHHLGSVRLSRPWTVSRSRARLRQILADRRPDVVVTHDSWPHTVFAPVVREAGIRLVHFIHGQAHRGHWLDRLASRTPPDLCVAHSRFTAGRPRPCTRQFRSKCGTAPRSAPSLNGPVRSEVRRELGTPDRAVVILQASRLERWKGQAVHLAALALLRDIPGWECWLAGGVQKSGERRFLNELRSIARRAGIVDRVRFLGQRADVPRLMAAADVFCQPNTGPEPYGIVLVEALYAGLPVVTSGLAVRPRSWTKNVQS